MDITEVVSIYLHFKCVECNWVNCRVFYYNKTLIHEMIHSVLNILLGGSNFPLFSLCCCHHLHNSAYILVLGALEVEMLVGLEEGVHIVCIGAENSMSRTRKQAPRLWGIPGLNL